MSDAAGPRVAIKTEIAVIGAGQAGLSSAYHLKQRGLEPGRGYVVLDQNPEAGGAWQHRWPSLTLSTVNRIHDLPGFSFAEAVPEQGERVEAAVAVPRYFAEYERRFSVPVYRPVTVKVVCERGDRFRVETDRETFSARGIINATGTWESPYIPDYPGRELFRGRQLHTHDYRTAEEFRGQHVLVVGGGISAIQLLDEISMVTTTTWVTRTPPRWREGPFDQEAGRAGRDGEPAVCTLLYRVEDSRVQSYFLGGKYPDVEEAARVAIVLEQVPISESVLLDDLAEKSGVARRKARIVLVLLKRHGLVREYRGGSWERLQNNLTRVDLSADLTDYEQRRVQDRAKLKAMIAYCQSAQCRTRFILEYFGEEVEQDWRCANCDACDGGLVVRRKRSSPGTMEIATL